jgi:hypothetical protein
VTGWQSYFMDFRDRAGVRKPAKGSAARFPRTQGLTEKLGQKDGELFLSQFFCQQVVVHGLDARPGA